MAAGEHIKLLCEEASCSICLDFFRDPVMLPECGHNFCRTCLTRSWREVGAEASCPQCRGRAQEGSLCPNLPLANLVEVIKQLSPLEAEWGSCKKRSEPLKELNKEDEAPLCALCGRSQEEAAQEQMAVRAARKERVCQKHEEPLKLFCKDDEALICVVCDRSKEHRDHETLPLEEASQEYKDQFCNCVEILRKEREKILVYKANTMKESEDLLKQTTGEKQQIVATFRQLHMFLEEQEKVLLAQMEEVEKEVVTRRSQHLTRLSEELSSLESLIQEMEEKCEQPARDLLQDVRSTLQRYEEKEAFENPAAFPLVLKWHIWDFSDLNHLWDGIRKQLKDTLRSGLHLQKASVTLDPDTAHRQLILSEGQKSVRRGENVQDLPTNPERFDARYIVLGHEGFTAGRHFWEVLVGSEGGWNVGVARKSVKRKGGLVMYPEEGIWKVGKCEGSYMASVKGHDPVLIVSGELRRIRVCLNYTGGRVAFFDADQAALLYEYSGASFSGETLLPFFWVNEKGHLKIS